MSEGEYAPHAIAALARRQCVAAKRRVGRPVSQPAQPLLKAGLTSMILAKSEIVSPVNFTHSLPPNLPQTQVAAPPQHPNNPPRRRIIGSVPPSLAAVAGSTMAQSQAQQSNANTSQAPATSTS